MARRCFDIAVASLLLLLTSPLLAAVAVGVKATSPGPVLHRATRAGVGGEPFTLLKFRTMVVGAAEHGPGVTRGGDPRVTRIGRILRSTKLDELPQLVNVLSGAMSIVGPRPEDPRYVALYNDEERAILKHRPGITSPASVRYRDEERVLADAGDDLELAYRRVMAEKLAIDLAYFEHRSLRSDVRVVGGTLRSVVRG